MATIPSVQLFRNSTIISGRTNAIAALEGQKALVADGGLILARYSKNGGEDNVKTLLGIVRNGGGTEAQLTIIDVEGAAENLQNAINNISGATAFEEGKFISAITQTNGVVRVKFGGVAAANVSVADASNKFTATTVEDVLLEIQNSLDAAIGSGGSVGTQISNAISGISGTTEITDGKVITAISQTDGKVSVSASTLGADNVSASAIASSDTTVAVTGTKVSEQIASLATSIKTVSTAAKTYSIDKITGDELTALGTNVREAYKLVDGGGTQAGETIKIYKDSSLKSVALDGQTLNFTYILADGSESTVGVDVSKFLAESEFKNGLEVVNGNVNVKIDTASETFLSVGESGVKLDGVQTAINKAKTKVEKKSDADKITLASATTEDGSVTYTIGQKDIASANALTAETNARESADTALSNRLGDGVTSELTATAQFTALNGKIEAETTARTNADNDLLAQLQTLSGTSASLSGDTSVNGAKKYTDAKIAEVTRTIGNLNATVSGESTHVDVTVEQTNGKITSVTVDSKDIASASALTAETTARTNADTELSNRLGDTITTAATVAAQLQALSGTSESNSGDTSVNGAKKYTEGKIAEIKATIVSTSGTSTTEAIKLIQTNGKIDSITLGAFDCGTY